MFDDDSDDDFFDEDDGDEEVAWSDADHTVSNKQTHLIYPERSRTQNDEAIAKSLSIISSHEGALETLDRLEVRFI